MSGADASRASWTIRGAEGSWPAENIVAVVNVERPGEIVGRFRSPPFAEVLIETLEGGPAPPATRAGEAGPFRLEMVHGPDRFVLVYEDEDLGRQESAS